MMGVERRGLAVLFTHPIQYFAPLLREVAAGREMVCFYCAPDAGEEAVGYGVDAQWDVPLLGGYRYEILSNLGRRLGLRGFFAHFNPGLALALRRGRFAALWIHGYYSASAVLAIFAAKATGTKVFLRGDSNEDRPMPAWRRLVKRLILKTLFRRIDAFLVVGARNQQYYQRYGVSPARCHPMRYSVDNERFRRQAAELAGQRAALRQAFGLSPDVPVFLFTGRFAPEKAVGLLLQAFAAARAAAPMQLLLVGGGPLEDELRREAARIGAPDAVRFAGFLNQTAIGTAYAAADALVLPSTYEPWGLVANEAMNFGLPCLVSDRVGCAGDLVVHELSGLVIPAGDTGAWASALARVAGDAELRRGLGREAGRRVADWSVARSAAELGAALQRVLA